MRSNCTISHRPLEKTIQTQSVMIVVLGEYEDMALTVEIWMVYVHTNGHFTHKPRAVTMKL
jgi:hypothetical protein